MLNLNHVNFPIRLRYVPYEQNKRGFPPEYEPDCCTGVTGVPWDADAFQKDWPPPHLDTGVTIHETWNAMVACKEAGLTRNVGVCNFKVAFTNQNSAAANYLTCQVGVGVVAP